VNENDEENFRHPANFSAASLRHTRDRTDLGKTCSSPHLRTFANKKMAGKIPAICLLKPIAERYAWLATALPSAACAAANRAIGTR
jgi:hypothetical protein